MGATITKLANKAKYLVGSLKEYPLESALLSKRLIRGL